MNHLMVLFCTEKNIKEDFLKLAEFQMEREQSMFLLTGLAWVA